MALNGNGPAWEAPDRPTIKEQQVSPQEHIARPDDVRGSAVRAIRVVRPKRGNDLTAAEVSERYIESQQPIVVELGFASFTADAVVTLATLSAAGHPIDVRGYRHEAELAADIRRLARHRRADVEQFHNELALANGDGPL